MDQWASELVRCMEHAPVSSHDIARVTHLLRAMAERPIGRRHRERCCELVAMAEQWAEKAQRGADTAAVLAELADLVARQLEDVAHAAGLYTRALVLHPTDVSVSERAVRQLSRLAAPDALSAVLEEHARTLDGMPWVDASERAAAWERLAAVTGALASASQSARRRARPCDDTPTRLYVPSTRREPEVQREVRASDSPVGRRSSSRVLLAACSVLAPAAFFVIATVAGDGPERGALSGSHEPRALAGERASRGAPPTGQLPEEVAIPPALAVRPSERAREPSRRAFALSVDRESIRVSGKALGRRQVARELRRALPKLEACVSAPRSWRRLELELSFRVKASGTVTRPLVRRTGRLSASEHACITSVLERGMYPVEGESARVKAVVVAQVLAR